MFGALRASSITGAYVEGAHWDFGCLTIGKAGNEIVPLIMLSVCVVDLIQRVKLGQLWFAGNISRCGERMGRE